MFFCKQNIQKSIFCIEFDFYNYHCNFHSMIVILQKQNYFLALLNKLIVYLKMPNVPNIYLLIFNVC